MKTFRLGNIEDGAMFTTEAGSRLEALINFYDSFFPNSITNFSVVLKEWVFVEWSEKHNMYVDVNEL